MRAFDAVSASLFLRRSSTQSLTALVISRSVFSGGFNSAGASGVGVSRFTTFIFRLFMGSISKGGPERIRPLVLCLIVDQPSSAVAEQHVYFLCVEHLGHLAVSERVVHHRLAASIPSIAVIR